MILLTGHRGFSGIAPENTLKSFEKALELGVDAIEFDVHVTKDNKLVVIHDGTLNRTTNGTGKVSDHTLSQIKELDAGSWKGPEYVGVKIPTLEEAIEFLKGKTRMWIEIKDAGTEEKIVETVEKLDVIEDVVLISFISDALIKVKTMNPLIPTSQIIWTDPQKEVSAEALISQCLMARANALSLVHHAANEKVLKAVKSRGIGLWVWTVDEIEDIRRIINLQVDAITSNHPNRVKDEFFKG